MKNLLAFAILFFITLSIFAQEVDVLKLRKKRFFKETNTFIVDTPLTIISEVCYNDPRSFDEEYCRSIIFIVKDTTEFKVPRIFSLRNDTSVIQCTYDRHSVWNWDKPSSKISGTVKVLKQNSKWIELEMDIKVNTGRVFIYKGKRRFLKKVDNHL